MKFRVGLLQKVIEEGDLIVEATDAVAAEEKAIKIANEGGVQWSFLEATEPVEIVSVEEAK